MLKKILFVILFLIISTSQSFAIDGIRKGFVIGAGVAYMPIYNWHEVINDTNGNTNGFGVKFSLGVNWNNRDLLALEVISMGKISNVDQKNNRHGYLGLAWYHDLDKTKESFFTSAGAGLSFGGIDNSGFIGTGIMLGGGYEIAKYVDVGLNYFYLNNGSLFTNKDYRFHIIHLALTVSVF